MSNTYHFSPSTGVLSAASYVQANCDYKCTCGREFQISLQWPEGLEAQGAISVTNAVCPSCSAPVIIPTGRHYLDGLELKTEIAQ